MVVVVTIGRSDVDTSPGLLPSPTLERLEHLENPRLTCIREVLLPTLSD